MAVFHLRKLALSLFAVFALSAGAVSSKHTARAPAPAPDCSSMVMQMADCLSYVSADNTTATRRTPSASCCSGFRGVLKTAGVQTGGKCLCDSFHSSPVPLNMTNAFALPHLCNVQNFSLRDCGHGPAAAPVPAGSPLAISPSASVMGNPPSAGSGSNEVVPAPGPGITGSSSSSLTISDKLLVLTAIAAVFFTSLY